ncbi:hypothetical protein BDV96DRAFT_684896 [Lophiotrema nucula]|uniref:Uncharacterized protein n=1 Tax=Lophiotrema nucula TaxID=690887 RepID=A0A6A5ZHG4_9PLEO|nr:hypothetical protein BDV96DRAFT_684896 [Lophiotrema nucula]
MSVKLLRNGLLDASPQANRPEMVIPALRFQKNRVQSPLLRLPKELSDMIYELVLGGRHIRVSRNHVKIQRVPPEGTMGIDSCIKATGT